jgi:hypothetical protein
VSKITKSLLEEYDNKLKWIEEGLIKAKDRRSYLWTFKKHKETIEDIDNLFRQYDVHTHDLKDLEKRIEDINEIEDAIGKREEFLKMGPAINEIAALLDRRLKVAGKHTKLRLILEDIDEIITYIEHINLELKSEPLVRNLLSLFIEREDSIEKLQKLEAIKSDIVALEQEISIQGNIIESFDVSINELMEAYEDIANCPTCGALRCHWGHEILGD